MILNNSLKHSNDFLLLSCDSRHNLYFTSLPPPLNTLEPTLVNQVFQAKQLSSKVIFKSCVFSTCLKKKYNKHLGTDKFGIMNCDKEAVDLSNEWEIIQLEDGFAFKSGFGKYLRVSSLDDSIKNAKIQADAGDLFQLLTLRHYFYPFYVYIKMSDRVSKSIDKKKA